MHERTCPFDDPLAYEWERTQRILQLIQMKARRLDREAKRKAHEAARQKRRKRLLLRREVGISFYGGVIGTTLLWWAVCMALVAITGIFPEMFDASGAWALFLASLLPFSSRTVRRATWLFHQTIQR